MNPRISSIENLIASDPGGRNIFGLALADQLRLAAQSLRLAQRVGIVSGFYIAEAGAGETDGPPGAKILGDTLARIGIAVDYITDALNAPLFRAMGLEPVLDAESYLAKARPSHLVAIERAGRGPDGRYRNMHGVDITDTTPPLDELFLEGTRRGLTTIGIGDGGNEIGMGKVFAELGRGAKTALEAGTGHVLPSIAQCVVPTDFCIVAGVSNWGAIGLAGALCVLEGRDLLSTAEMVAGDLEKIVRQGGAVDGVTHRAELTTDGQDRSATFRILEQVRRQLAPSPLSRDEPLLVGILGYGETGRAVARLLQHRGHRVVISDAKSVTVDPPTTVAGVEAGGHTIEFLEQCDLIVASPGVPVDQPILNALHRRGIYVMSEMELAYQLGPIPSRRLTPCGSAAPARTSDVATPGTPLIAVTGTVGKRTTVELLQRLFRAAGRSLAIGGNRGEPLSALLLDRQSTDPIAVAVSSFQLETVVHFRPQLAILLNVSEAHLDRHHSVAEYVRIKARVFMNQGSDDILILPFDDERLRTLARRHQGRTFFVSSQQAVDRGAWLTDGCIRMNVDGCVEELGPADPLQTGLPTFAENLLAAVLAARLCGLETERIVEALRQPGVLQDGDAARIRERCRTGAFRRPTVGVARGFAQANLIVLRSDAAVDFRKFCELNPKPCPLLEVTEPGCYEPIKTAPGADLRTDLPRYRVYRRGVCVDRPLSIEAYWTDDCVAFLIGCSFTFDAALLAAGLPVRHVEQGCNVPMYRTNRRCKPAGLFAAPLIVSMRPMTADQAQEAVRITAAFSHAHGEPVQIGHADEIGIRDLDRPDYGDAVTVHSDEIPVFWACGVTPLEAIVQAKPDLAITHEPGHMFVTDALEGGGP